MSKNKGNSVVKMAIFWAVLICCLLGCAVFIFLTLDILARTQATENIDLNVVAKVEEDKNTLAEIEQDIFNAREKRKELSLEFAGLRDVKSKLDESENIYFQKLKALEQDIKEGKSDQKIAYLTFDDGPYDLTTEYLKVLKEKDVPATFFVLGKPSREQAYLDIVADGHTIANHSYSHDIKEIYKSVDVFMEDVKKLDSFIKELTGKEARVIRFPGGSASAKELKEPIIKQLHENGYRYIDWSAATMDGMTQGITPEQAYNNAINQINGKKLPVVLMHDYNKSSLSALPDIIDKLKEQGYIFAPLFVESETLK